jgi:hypothetical protein
MILIGISGKKRSGKNTIADMLSSITSRKVYQIALADALKNEVAQATGVSRIFIDEHKTQFRPILQWWGTDFRRHFVSDNYWILKLGKAIRDHQASPQDIIVVPDVRFKDEYKFIMDIGGTMIRVERDYVNGVTDSHQSEIDLDDVKFQHVITNNGTLDELRNETRNIMKKVGVI